MKLSELILKGESENPNIKQGEGSYAYTVEDQDYCCAFGYALLGTGLSHKRIREYVNTIYNGKAVLRLLEMKTGSDFSRLMTYKRTNDGLKPHHTLWSKVIELNDSEDLEIEEIVEYLKEQGE